MTLLSCISSSPGRVVGVVGVVGTCRGGSARRWMMRQCWTKPCSRNRTAASPRATASRGESGEQGAARHDQSSTSPRGVGPRGHGKLNRLLDEVRNCLAQGHNPIIFCHFVSTADYVGEQLRRAFPEAQLAVVTGRTGDAAQREAAVMQLGDAPKRILVGDGLPERRREPAELLRCGNPLRPFLEPHAAPATGGRALTASARRPRVWCASRCMAPTTPSTGDVDRAAT